MSFILALIGAALLLDGTFYDPKTVMQQQVVWLKMGVGLLLIQMWATRPWRPWDVDDDGRDQ